MHRVSVVILGLFMLSRVVLAEERVSEEPLLIVTDPWPPHAYVENNQIVGSDVEVALAVLAEMGLEANIMLMPWKRCLAIVEAKQADAILAAAITEKRKTFLHFPFEPVSAGDTVFFKRTDSPIDMVDLDNRMGHSVGSVLGYSYCDLLDESELIVHSSRVASVEQNFKKLMLGRIDLLVAAEPVGYFRAAAMGVSDQVTVVPNSRFCSSGNYLAFSKKPGHDDLSRQFAEQLKIFKESARYQEIMHRYGLPAQTIY